MTTPTDAIALAEWRRSVAELYARVRELAATSPEAAWRIFREGRDALFARHSQTPLSPEQLARFHGLDYFPYDPAWRVLATVEAGVEHHAYSVDLGEDGVLRYTRVARLHFTVVDAPASLDLYWIEGYGGGLFLPFRDLSNGSETYGGGRYLLDTIKGADLGMAGERMILDFNFAYNPSCAYHARWVCPLAPPSNHLPYAVRAGEKVFA